MGEVPVASSVVPYVVNPEIDYVLPSPLNPAGGDTVIITGTGFPSAADKGDFIVAMFSDYTNCQIISV